jgi:hypothetical protein
MCTPGGFLPPVFSWQEISPGATRLSVRGGGSAYGNSPVCQGLRGEQRLQDRPVEMVNPARRLFSLDAPVSKNP